MTGVWFAEPPPKVQNYKCPLGSTVFGYLFLPEVENRGLGLTKAVQIQLSLEGKS